MGLQIKTQVSPCRRVERHLSFLAMPDPYYSRTFPNLYIDDRQRRDFTNSQTRLEHQLYQRVIALGEPMARLTRSPQ